MNENDRMIMQLAQDIAFIKATLIGDISTMKEDIKNIESKLEKESEKTAEIVALKTRIPALEDRLAKVESNNLWITRAFITAIISVIVGAFTVVIK